MRLSNHVKRIITAAIGAPLLILFIVKANVILFSILVIACIIVGMRELYQLLEYQKINCFKYFGLLLGLFLAVLFLFCPFDPMVICFGLTVIIIMLFLRALSSPHNIKEVNQGISGTLLGILYIPLCLSHLILIRRMEYGSSLVLFLLVIIWSSDIGAYYAGTLLGKHKLCPTISPKKPLRDQ